MVRQTQRRVFGMMSSKTWGRLLLRNWSSFVTEVHSLQFRRRLLLAACFVLEEIIQV